MRLKDRIAIVTGAATGIGIETARALAQAGADVVIAARKPDLAAEAIADIDKTAPGRTRFEMLDLSELASIRAFADRWAGKPLHILINNAGGSRSFKDLHVSDAQWQEAMTLNFHRPRQLADALIDQMIAGRWGRIVNITGKSEPEHVNGAFCAKAGIHSWAKGLSRMVGTHGITVNCIPPGRIHSEQILRNYTPEYRQWQADNEIPMGRYGEPEDLANLVCFLASPKASYITGAVIPVDGGLRRYQF